MRNNDSCQKEKRIRISDKTSTSFEKKKLIFFEKYLHCNLTVFFQRTPLQLPCQSKVGIYFAQSKNTIAMSSNVTLSSEDDEDEEECDQMEISNDGSLKKRKKNFSDVMDKKYLKIRKTFDSNITIVDEDDNPETKSESNTLLQSSQKKTENCNSSNIKSNISNTTETTSVNSNDKKILDYQENLEGFDDLFEEEWSFKNETTQEFDGLFEEDWTYDKQIDFTNPKRCMIIDIVWEKTFMILTVKDNSNDLLTTVQCSGIW